VPGWAAARASGACVPEVSLLAVGPHPRLTMDDGEGRQEPLIETGTFHYDSGASYEGEFTMMLEDGRFFVPPAEEEAEDAGAKKAPPKAEEAEGEPAKPPVRVRQVHPTPSPRAGSSAFEPERENLHAWTQRFCLRRGVSERLGGIACPTDSLQRQNQPHRPVPVSLHTQESVGDARSDVAWGGVGGGCVTCASRARACSRTGW